MLKNKTAGAKMRGIWSERRAMCHGAKLLIETAFAISFGASDTARGSGRKEKSDGRTEDF